MQRELARADAARVHEEVVPLVDLHVLKRDIPAAPERLQRVGHAHALQGEPLHVTEHFGGLHERVAHGEAAAVPDGGAAALAEDRVADEAVLIVPEGVLAVELAVSHLEAGALLEGGLAGVDGDALQARITQAEKRSLAAVFFVLYECFIHDSKDKSDLQGKGSAG